MIIRIISNEVTSKEKPEKSQKKGYIANTTSNFNELGMGLGNLPRLSSALTRSISAENPTGEKSGGGMAKADPSGPARELGIGWKCRPCVHIEPDETYVLADIDGPGAIQSMWFGGNISRDFIVRIYWDHQEQPSVETPLPDFFATH